MKLQKLIANAKTVLAGTALAAALPLYGQRISVCTTADGIFSVSIHNRITPISSRNYLHLGEYNAKDWPQRWQAPIRENYFGGLSVSNECGPMRNEGISIWRSGGTGGEIITHNLSYCSTGIEKHTRLMGGRDVSMENPAEVHAIVTAANGQKLEFIINYQLMPNKVRKDISDWWINQPPERRDDYQRMANIFTYDFRSQYLGRDAEGNEIFSEKARYFFEQQGKIVPFDKDVFIDRAMQHLRSGRKKVTFTAETVQESGGKAYNRYTFSFNGPCGRVKSMVVRSITEDLPDAIERETAIWWNHPGLEAHLDAFLPPYLYSLGLEHKKVCESLPTGR
jgi:hypothetical protein